jgi:hypothetical protein
MELRNLKCSANRLYRPFPAFRALLISGLLLAGGTSLRAADTPPTAPSASQKTGITTIPELTLLPRYFSWATVALGDGTLGMIDERQFKYSSDDGRTFHEMIDLPRPANGAPRSRPRAARLCSCMVIRRRAS